jgi:signal transduction histidine kinase
MPLDELASATWQHSLTPFYPNRYRGLLHHLPQAFCLVEVLFDALGTAVDYRFLEINPAFAQQTGLSNPVGRTRRELAPAPEPGWYEVLGKVARTGQATHGEQRTGNRWYEVHALPTGPPGSHQVALLFTDSTARKAAEQYQAYLLWLSDTLRPLANPQAIEEAVTHTAQAWFGVDRCYYCSLTGDEAIIERDAACAPLSSLAGRYSLSKSPLLKAVVALGQPLVIDDVHTTALVNEELRQLCQQLQIVSFLAVPVLKQGQPVGILCLGHRTPRTWTSLEAALATETAERTWAAGERTRAEAALRERERQQTFLVQLQDALRPLHDAGDVQTVAAHLLGQYLGANQVHYGETQGDYVVIHQGYGDGLPAMVGRFYSPDFGERLTATHRAGLVQVVPDIETDESSTEAERQVLRQAGIKAYITVPLVKAGQWVATLAVHSLTLRPWTAEEVNVVKEVAERTWATVERARAEAALREREQRQTLFEAVQRGQEEERRRMAESLHDGLGQMLYATKLQLDRLPALPEEPARREAARLLTDAIRQTRALSHELSPMVLEDFGLPTALESICRQLGGPTLHWHCHLDLDEAAPLPKSLQLALYRMAQNLAHNVAQHAQASQATLEVEVLPDWVVLRVEDNGRGFNLVTVHEGLGLKTLRSRTALLGGVVQLDTTLGKGTQVLVRLPLT